MAIPTMTKGPAAAASCEAFTFRIGSTLCCPMSSTRSSRDGAAASAALRADGDVALTGLRFCLALALQWEDFDERLQDA
jgi:hypothetical protein